MKYNKLFNILFLLLVSTNCYSQFDHNISKKDTMFINEITENENSCRGCPFYDYYLLIHIRYGDIVKDVIVRDDYLKYYCTRYLKIPYGTKYYIRDVLINDKEIPLPKRKTKGFDSDLYNGFSDTDYSDSTFSELINNKDAFLNYYFDENKEYKFYEQYKKVSDTNLYIHDKLFEAAAVIYQLLKWGIPVYYNSEYRNFRYGYFK